ncbi:tRNA (5-methylaminomethyl-2-thiouridine)(34)-methyltransferase MnmD [Salmonirosea aquatica]|uniref:tRNA (5-methylaminomethyl-2-thiouridine)(34)-methyltransferase MnmD n=1 Tax=Salmonirosea aquatica TaxID=2654236 RepID=A0A7C9FPQ9_9BACT|nr:tRNA (5-methylaminomethyl-2-thiouridine)(34)-methyltransferase MnmD [Cytophagaceae bacterium SJW1-29]
MDSLPSRLFLTEDGSHTLYDPGFDQHYHSIHGSLQESRRIFIELGIDPFLDKADEIRIFEMGLGTGLNALLTWQWAEQHRKPVEYVGIEAYPISDAEAEQLNYGALVGQDGLASVHQAAWGTPIHLSPYFTLVKHQTLLQHFSAEGTLFDVIYYDAFAPRVQPELWTAETFAQVAAFTKTGGYLVTYCAKSDVQRALRSAGFRVEKHPGPWGKRHVLRGVKE